MSLIIQNLEKMLAVFDEVVGRVPVLVNPLEGRVRYEIARINAAGLASHGVAGIATGEYICSARMSCSQLCNSNFVNKCNVMRRRPCISQRNV
jgi:hypothetical protein